MADTTTTHSRTRGLSSEEAARRLARFGANRLPAGVGERAWQKLLRQFRSPIIYILLFALVVDLGVWLAEGRGRMPLESFVIASILLLNALLGWFQERKAERSLARLRELAAPQVWVVRDGTLVHLPSAELVPGDVVRLEAGDRVPCDGSLLHGDGVRVDESVLTGESIPIDKPPGADVMSGTLMVRGSGLVEVERTGERSAMGRLATLLEEVEDEKTPLERRLERFGRRVARWVVVLVVVLVSAGIAIEGPDRITHVLLFAVALGVAAVPEGLPAVLTLTLAIGVERMARRKAVVRKLVAVEALGSVTVIATDKTGTLTENRMEVRRVDAADPDTALAAMVLANDAEDHLGAGDPLELGLLTWATARGTDVEAFRAARPRISTVPFDSTAKFMRVTVQEPGGVVSYVKGAPEALLAMADLGPDEKRDWETRVETHAAGGYRLLALARQDGEGHDALDFLGLVLLWDPPREEVAGAMRRCQRAGIRVVMVTGDHPATASTVARDVGIPHDRFLVGDDLRDFSPTQLAEAARTVNVFARVSPEHKLRLVEALQAEGEVVAVTGDGVNDAPALKKADVGVAMGQRGSDVSREVADLVLLDDDFSSIVAAIEEGRSIFENIQKFIRFLFATNLSEVLVVSLGVVGAFVLGLDTVEGALLLPLTAAQILWVNLITDGAPALALAPERNPGVVNLPPRAPDSPLLDRPSLRYLVVTGCLNAVVGLSILAVLPALGYALEEARTATFLFLAAGQLVLVYPARHTNLRPRANPAVHVAVVFGLLLQTAVFVIPALGTPLAVKPLDLAAWAMVGAAVLVVWGVAEVVNRWLWKRERSPPAGSRAEDDPRGRWGGGGDAGATARGRAPREERTSGRGRARR